MSITVSGEFKRQVDANAASLVESYRILLKKTQVGSSLQPQDELLLDAAASNIELHAHSFLDQINEMRMHLLLRADPEAPSGSPQCSGGGAREQEQPQ